MYPSDFGLERLSREEIEGPVGLLDEDSKSHDHNEESHDHNKESVEGEEYSREKLRQYQLSRFKYVFCCVTLTQCFDLLCGIYISMSSDLWGRIL